MKKLDVYYSGWGEHWKLGQLADNGRNLLFEYSPEAQRQSLELSPLHLKLSSQAYGYFPPFQMRLPGLIADSLPDGWGLYLMDKLFRKKGINIHDISPLDRLAFLGDRAMGALTFEPASEKDVEPQDLSLFTIAKEVHKLIVDDASKALPLLAMIGGSPQGARPKALVDYDPKSGTVSTNLTDSNSPWFIKFPGGREHKEVCAIEILYARMAKKAGLEAVDTQYFDLGKNLAAFGMKRFDREKTLRVPIHSLAGVLHADYRIPSSVDYLSFLRLTRLMTKDVREVLKAFRHCVFNVVFNNRDDHPKNFSFLLDRKKDWKLTPPYDLTFSPGPGGEHQMDICGEGRSPGRAHLLKLGEQGGLDTTSCEEILNQTQTVATQFKGEAKDWPIRKATIQKIDRAIQVNLKRLR